VDTTTGGRGFESRHSRQFPQINACE